MLPIQQEKRDSPYHLKVLRLSQQLPQNRITSQTEIHILSFVICCHAAYFGMFSPARSLSSIGLTNSSNYFLGLGMGCTPVVEYFPSTHRVLGSLPSTGEKQTTSWLNQGFLFGQSSLLSQSVILESLRSPRLLCCGGPQVFYILIEPPIQNHSQKRYFQHYIQDTKILYCNRNVLLKWDLGPIWKF